MCGIAGSINHYLNIPVLTRDLLHRGPDEQSTFEKDSVQLHHHRLSILDIACGKQPMHLNELTIIFNGEIYNHLDVRRKHSLQCTTGSDTETILHAYRKLGADCLNDFDGMFAFAILDRSKNELFIARDRAGKKPVYYYSFGRQFVFASELNALKNQVDLAVNETNLHQYVRTGYFFKTNTPYQYVYEMEAGSYVSVSMDTGKIQQKKWWNIHDYYLHRTNDDEDTALQKTDELIHLAVKRRVESSDLEVGSFLSGGIDSGLVSAIAKQYNPGLKTFTVSFAGEYDEAPLARLVADRYKTHHHVIPIAFDSLLGDVENILGNYGEPFFDSSAIPSYYVSREARKYLTVVLNGDGGDELFGGYRRYVPFAKYDFFSPSPFSKKTAGLINKILPVPNNKKSKYNFLYRLVDIARKEGVDAYLSSTIDIFEGYEQFLSAPSTTLAEMKKSFALIKESKLSGLQKIMNLDFDNILAGDLLVKMDIATMTHSLEGRSPLLSKELLEYIPGLSDDLKIKGGQTKYLLRKLARKYLPAELINQPKRGFEIPLKKWVDGDLSDLIASYILPKDAFCRSFFREDFLDRIWTRKLNVGDEKRAKMIWTFFALEVWYRKCYLSK